MASTKRRQREQLPGWVWMLFGLSLGLGVALVVYLESGNPVISNALREQVSVIRPAGREQPIASPASPQDAPAADDAPAAPATEADEPGLSFYTRLRDSEVVVPDSRPAAAREAPAAAERFELQAGSFPNIQGADTRQATLALLGIASRIDPTLVDDTMRYRVIIGPLSGRDELNRVTRRLEQEEIEFFRRSVSSPD